MGISENNLRSKDQSAVLGTSLSIEIKNKIGENLLGTDKFPIAEIFVKYNRDDLQTTQTTKNTVLLDNPNNILFVDEKQSKYVKIFLNHSKSENFPMTYIHWNKTDIDTIKAKYKKNENSIVLEKLWIFKNNSWEEIKSKPLVLIK
ncbi:hypothetical protein OD917_21150 [Flavobacterium sp. SH_e]|uniref:hypothetical protein n=1 Tax=Flavobacterium TaxID=237 RepID=UPI0021E4CDA6|nr:hypothetical protein [Flavobacterium sp. SH_e]MCV2487455.1 hypothetical protein [Flavobacterium sp. SH_e]